MASREMQGAAVEGSTPADGAAAGAAVPAVIGALLAEVRAAVTGKVSKDGTAANPAATLPE